MTETHILNTEYKRLEPKETLCQFCKKEHSERMAINYFCPVYRTGKRTNLLVYRSVKYNRIDIGIPRCKNCCKIHADSITNGGTISVLFTIVIGIIVYAATGPYVIFYLVFGPPLFLILGPRWIADILTERKEILTEKNAAWRDQFILSMLKNGWSLKQPNA